MKKFIIKNNMPALFTGIFITLMLTVFLLWFDASGYTAITEAKLPVFFIICGAYIVGMLFMIAVSGAWPKKLCAEQWLVMAYLLLSVLSALCSPNREETWIGATRYEGVITIVVYCIVFFLVSCYGKAEKWLLWPLGIGITVLCVVSILELYGHNPFNLYPEGMNYFGAGKLYSGKYLGTIGNADLLVAFFCIAVPTMWVSFLRLDGKRRYAILLPLFLSLFVLLKMNVAAGLLGVFGGGLVSIPVVFPCKARRRKALAWMLLALIVLGLVFIFFADIGSGTLHELHALLHGDVSDKFGTSRVYIWRNVLRLVPERLWLGAGPDTLSLADIEPFTRYEPSLNKTFVARIDTAHNEYLNVLYHQGVFALLAYLAALIFAAVRWIKQSEKNTACAVMGAAVLGYCIQAFFGISMFITAPFFWISFGLLVGTYNNGASQSFDALAEK